MSAFEQMAACGVVPVVRIARAKDAPTLVGILARAGLTCVEVTFRTDAAADAIAAIRSEAPDVLVGAGTVVSMDQLDQACEVGAAFIVSPGFQPAVVRACFERGVPIFPGVLTPSEILQALDAGLSALKLFPAASAGGPAYLRTLAGPFPTVRFMPTGGIAPGDLVAYKTDPRSGEPVASRPLCRYPGYPRYVGSGDPNLASSFVCAAPAKSG